MLASLGARRAVGRLAPVPAAGAAPPAASRRLCLGRQLDGRTRQRSGVDSSSTSDVPAAVLLPSGVTPTAIAAGGGGGGGDTEARPQNAAYAIGSDGRSTPGGDNSNGALGNGTTVANSGTPVVVSLPSGVTGQPSVQRKGPGMQLARTATSTPGVTTTLANWATAAGDQQFHTRRRVTPLGCDTDRRRRGLRIRLRARLGQEGLRLGRQLLRRAGRRQHDDSSTPVPVSLPTGVTATAIAGGGGTGFAIGSDGHLYGWGYNSIAWATTAPRAATRRSS